MQEKTGSSRRRSHVGRFRLAFSRTTITNSNLCRACCLPSLLKSLLPRCLACVLVAAAGAEAVVVIVVLNNIDIKIKLCEVRLI